jgi:hypothetical protein
MRVLNWVYAYDANAETPEDEQMNAKLEDEIGG